MPHFGGEVKLDMRNILLIKSSLNGEQSKSNQLADQLVANLSRKGDESLVVRDVAAEPLPHLSQSEMGAWMTAATERTLEQQQLANVSDELVEELQASDTVVIAMPMYNFAVPSSFKAWTDRIARAGITFKYTDTGPVGLLSEKTVIIVATRGGIYQGTAMDSQTQFLKDFFSFIGLSDIHFVYAEGLNMPGGEASFAAAQKEIDTIEL